MCQRRASKNPQTRFWARTCDTADPGTARDRAGSPRRAQRTQSGLLVADRKWLVHCRDGRSLRVHRHGTRRGTVDDPGSSSRVKARSSRTVHRRRARLARHLSRSGSGAARNHPEGGHGDEKTRTAQAQRVRTNPARIGFSHTADYRHAISREAPERTFFVDATFALNATMKYDFRKISRGTLTPTHELSERMILWGMIFTALVAIAI